MEKSIGNVLTIHGDEEYCAIIASNSESPSEKVSKYYSVVVCDEVGTVWSTKILKIHPDHVSMNDRLMVVSDHRNVYLYIFDSLNQLQHSSFNPSQSRFSNGMERMFDIHDKSIHPSKANGAYEINNDTSDPSITAICATPSFCLIGLEDNHIILFSLPNITRLNKISIECNIPKVIEVNCNCTKFSVVDYVNTFQIFDLEKRPLSKIGVKSYLQSSSVQHVWAMKWSREDPYVIVVLDKGTLVEINLSVQIEMHVILAPCDGYLMGFSNLEVALVLLDEIMLRPYEVSKYCILTVPSKSLEDARIALTIETNNKEEVLSKFSHTSKKHLWTILGNQALEILDFVVAEQAFVLSENYAGLLLIERISLINDQELQRAEVLKFIGRFQDAEKKYLDLNRPDLAIQMAINSGEWLRAKSLMIRDGFGDSLIHEAWSSMAENCVYQNKYEIAAEVSFFFAFCSIKKQRL